MTTEKNAFAHLKRIAPKTCRLSRIENSVGTGVPDCFFRSYHREGWIENKVGLLQQDRTLIKVGHGKLKPAQEAWLTAYVARGGHAYVHLFVSTKLFFLLPFSYDVWANLRTGMSPDLWQVRHRFAGEIFGER